MGEPNGEPRQSAFEPWMVANFAAGAGYAAFVSLLIPAFITEATGNAAEAGVVMSIIALGAVLGPVLGGFADKYRAHRLLLNLGVLGLAIGFAGYALSAETQAVYALEAIVLGVSVAAIAVLGQTFIVGSGLSKEAEAKQLTTYNLLYPLGQIAGGAIIGWVAAQGWPFSDRFWLASGIMVVGAIVTYFTSAVPAARLNASLDARASEMAAETAGATSARATASLKAVLFSSFGMFLLIALLSSVTTNGINSQLANIMPNVYGYSAAQTATLISVAGGLNLLATIGTGMWMTKSDPLTVFAWGTALRTVGAAGMAVIGLIGGFGLLLPGLFMQVLYQGGLVSRIPQASVGIRFAPIPPGAATGFVIGAVALGGFLGGLIGGFAANQWGFNSVNWMGGIAGALAVILILVALLPAWRQRAADDPAAPSAHAAPAPHI